MSGPGKRLAVPLLQLLDRHMRVPLRGAQRRMAEHLLNLAQVRSPVQHVRRRAVPQRMRADIGPKNALCQNAQNRQALCIKYSQFQPETANDSAGRYKDCFVCHLH